MTAAKLAADVAALASLLRREVRAWAWRKTTAHDVRELRAVRAAVLDAAALLYVDHTAMTTARATALREAGR